MGQRSGKTGVLITRTPDMNKLIASTATALFIASAQITFAQSISVSNPDTLINMLNESGYPTELVTDSYGDP